MVTIITGILITTVTFGILAIASKDVRTALFGMNKLKAELNEKQSMLEEASGALVNVKNDLNTTKEEYAKSKKNLEETQEDLEIAQQAAELLRQEQVALQNRNQELWSDNQTLIEHNQSLVENNQFLLANNESLKADNLELEKTNNDLQEGIENIRERPIIYRVGELLASGVIKKTDDPVKIQNDLNQIIALANSKIIDRLGTEGSKDGVWIYPIEYQKAMDRLKQAKGDTVIRLIVAANLVKGDPVLTELEMHPNRVVYQENEFVYQKIYNVPIDGSNSEMLISDFLRNVNMTAINNGILPNPLTGTVGVINGNQIYAIEKALAENRGKDVLISAFAAADTEVLGPLRLHIYLKMKQSKRLIMNDEILAIDPGREKTGIAILKNSDVLEHKIINSDELVQIIKSLLEKYIIKTIVMGNGTSSKKNMIY